MPADKKVLQRISLSVYILFCLFISIGTIVRPDADWDVLAYTAIVLQEEHPGNPAELHQNAYATVKEKVSEKDWYTLTGGHPYRIEQASNPDSFISMLGMYKVKVGYIAVIEQLSRYVHPLTAIWVTSLLSTLGLLAVFGWYTYVRGQGALLAFSIPAFSALGIVPLAGAATPDMLFSFVFAVGIVLMMREYDYLAAAAFVAAVVIRPDNIVFAIVLAATAAAFRLPWKPYLISFLISLPICLYIAKATGHPGWWRHYIFVSVQIQQTMIGFDPPFSPLIYIKGLIENTAKSLAWHAWPWVASALILANGTVLRLPLVPQDRAAACFGALALSLLGKFVIIPVPDDRIYLAYLLGLGIVFVELLARRSESHVAVRQLRPQERLLSQLEAKSTSASL